MRVWLAIPGADSHTDFNSACQNTGIFCSELRAGSLKEEFPPVSQFSAGFCVSGYDFRVGFMGITALSEANLKVLYDYYTDSGNFGCQIMSLKGAGSIARLYMSPKLILTSLWLTGAKGFFLRKKKPYCDTGGNSSFKYSRSPLT